VSESMDSSQLAADKGRVASRFLKLGSRER
jgi:hypothetical protein